MGANALVLHAIDRVMPPANGIVPTDPPRAHASGPAPYRLVVFGAPSATSDGVARHELGLIGAIARRVAGLTGHGVDVDAVAARAGDARSLARAVRGRDLAKVDGVVLVVDPDVLEGRGEPLRRLHHLLVQLWGTVTPASSITVAVTPASDAPIDADHTDALVELCGGTAGLTRVVELAPAPPTSSAGDRYAAWGSAVADTVAGSLVEPIVWSDAVEDLDDRKRSAVIRRLGPFDRDWEAGLQSLVRDAARAYGAASAAVTVLDGPQARYLAGAAVADVSMPREETICDVALRTYGGVLVGDAQADEVFQHLPSVESGAVRFYAGHRIDSPEGIPLAVLCVFDPEPRKVRGQDITLLRDFAHLAERLIREYRRRTA
jgi:GAF domain-containing protein